MGRGRIFDISRGCVDDGPGLRTTVFLKGCPLKCPWCHNPEGKSYEIQIGYDPKKCIACKLCADVCPREWDFETPNEWRNGCTACGKCAQTCPSGARKIVGRDVEPSELIAELLKDRDFFEGTGGGVTFSGGEPFFQPSFLEECLYELKKEGINTAVETSGFWNSELINLAEKFDLILFDIKHVDREKFARVIGKDNSIILNNLKKLSERDVDMEIRLTLIPEFNDTEDDLITIGNWIKSLPREIPVKVQNFHRLASAKAEILWIDYPYAKYEPPTIEKVERAKEILSKCGIFVK